MASLQLPIESFPAWALLQDVEFLDVHIQNIENKGYGITADKDLDGNTKVLSVPQDIVLSASQVDQYAKVDQHFKTLLEALGQQSPRIQILLFLLTQLVGIKAKNPDAKRCTSTPWTEYIRFIPHEIPVPTMWTEPEQLLLNGTSLQDALSAKLAALNSEFESLRELSSGLPFWNSLLWDSNAAAFNDWLLVDAWYRSRCLELPLTGTSMVPAIDMVNHAQQATAYYDEDDQDSVALRIRPNCRVLAGEEITISYGDMKPAAEMLFSYGFIDEDIPANKMVLHLTPIEDDPLAKAKLHIFDGPPTVTLELRDDGALKWNSPFAILMCLNEEDGLEFRVLQDEEGNQQLKLFWNEEDVTKRTDDFETLVQDHELKQVFMLRTVAVLHGQVETQLQAIQSGPSQEQLDVLIASDIIRPNLVEACSKLKDIEGKILAAAAAGLEAQKADLLADERVVAYLGLMEESQNEQAPVEADASTSEVDFS